VSDDGENEGEGEEEGAGGDAEEKDDWGNYDKLLA
jgi:hypothetical protein